VSRYYSKSDKASGWLAAGTLGSAQVARPMVIPYCKNPLNYYVRNPHVIGGLPRRPLVAILGRALARIGDLETELEAKAKSEGAQ
jgi:hypothetical protein